MIRRVWVSLSILLMGLASSSIGCRHAVTSVRLTSGWRFRLGDDPGWANPGWDDTAWQIVASQSAWDQDTGESADGFRWFRIRFYLPEALRKSAMTPFDGDSLQIVLGMRANQVQIFLNGLLIGETRETAAVAIDPPTSIPSDTVEKVTLQRYRLSAGDPRIQWNADNVLAIRIQGRGWVDPRLSEIRMVTWKEDLFIDPNRPIRLREGRFYEKEVVLANRSHSHSIQGYFTLRVVQIRPRRILSNLSHPVDLPPGARHTYSVHWEPSPGHPCRAAYIFIDRKTRESVTVREPLPTP